MELLPRLPAKSVDAIITDPCFGLALTRYDWGYEQYNGDPFKWWEVYGPVYEEWRRVIQPSGVIAFAMGYKFKPHFKEWFGGYRIWSFARNNFNNIAPFAHIWIVQTASQEPIRFPDADSLIEFERREKWRKIHPNGKAYEEMEFMVRHLTKPGQIILDNFCGLGTTLVAAKRLNRHYIGCDKSLNYPRYALMDLQRNPGEV
jgi:site-specific DNA-methyltransferase (adenine-specific)